MTHDVDQVEAYLAEKTGLPLERVSRIYRAGSPWPLLMKQLDRKVEHYAQAHGVTFDQACAAIEAWSKEEEARLREFLAAIQTTEGKPEFWEKLGTCCADPLFQEWREHSQRVGALTGEHRVMVFFMHFALHDFSMEHPDWDPEELTTTIRPS